MADYTPIIQQAAQRFDVDPKLIQAVIQTESGGNPDAVSPAGAIGLGQIMPATAKSLGIDPKDPTQNIYGTAQILSQNLDKFGNVPDALRAYNGGWNPSNWSNSETQAYVGKVASAYAAPNQQPAAPAPQGVQLAQAGASDVPLTTPGSDAFSKMFPDLASSIASGQQSPSAPAFNRLFPDLANSGTQQGAQGTQGQPAKPPGFWSNLGAGLEHSASASGPFFGALNNMTAWGDKNIPGAQQVDNLFGGPSASQNSAVTANVAAGQKAFQSGAGSTTGGAIGNMAGTVALTAPLAELGSGALGGVLGAAGDAASSIPLVSRLANAGKVLATGSGAPGLTGQLAGAVTSGALKGAIASTAAGGSPISGAEAGAALGPVGMAAAPIARGMMLLTGKAGSAALDALAPAAANDAGSAAPVGTPSVTSQLGGASSAPAQDIPTSLPKIGLALTQSGADKAADKIIQHFAQGGPTDIAASPIPGVQRTLSQATGNPGIATLERAVSDMRPQAFTAQDAASQAARAQVISSLTGTPGDIDAATAARDAMTSAARQAAFANAKPVDAQPVVDQVEQLIAQNQCRPTVQAPLQQVLKQLVQKVPDPTVDPNTGAPTPGATIEQPISDPATLYNVRKYIGDIISPKAAGTAQDGRAAAAQLMTLKPVLDDTIESGAPGYKAYIQQFDQLSQPINGMQALQKLNLYDAQGNVTLAKLDNAVKSLQSQQNAPGYKLADSITPDQMQQLILLRDDMRARSMNTLGRSLGSNTFQNLATNSVLNAAGSHGGHAVGALLGAVGGGAALGPAEGGIGSMLALGGAHMAAKTGANSGKMVMDSLVNKLTNPQAAATALQAAARKARP